jgi:hypothetical protein
MKSGPLQQAMRLEVPPGTEFVHAALTSSYMAYGDPEVRIPRDLAAIGYEIQVDTNSSGKVSIENGCCTIFFKAILENTALEQNSVTWTGYFVLEVMYFGRQ